MSQRLQVLQQLLEKNPDDSFALFAIAKEFEKMNDPDQALEYYNRLRRSDPGYVGLYYHLGKLYEKKNRPDDALKAYKEGIDVARKAGDMHALSELNEARLGVDEDEDEI